MNKMNYDYVPPKKYIVEGRVILGKEVSEGTVVFYDENTDSIRINNISQRDLSNVRLFRESQLRFMYEDHNIGSFPKEGESLKIEHYVTEDLTHITQLETQKIKSGELEVKIKKMKRDGSFDEPQRICEDGQIPAYLFKQNEFTNLQYNSS